MEISLEIKKTLSANKAAQEQFFKMPLSHQREYIKWIEEAKQAPMRERRMHKMIEKLLKTK